jgi:uncharacterized membrane protein (DUF373 family)
MGQGYAMDTIPSPAENTPRALKFLLSVIARFEAGIIIVLIVLMAMVVLLSTIELGVELTQRVADPPRMLLNLQELLEVLGFFMMVLIGLELLETIKNYLTQHALHVEVVLLVAMIAVARKVIILDMTKIGALSMIGIAVLLFSLSVSYFLIKRAMDAEKSLLNGIQRRGKNGS